MRTVATALVLILFAFGGLVSAQAPADGWGVDSSLRVEFLFGEQFIREPERASIEVNRFRLRFDPRLAVLSGMAEISPLSWASGRLAGSLGIFEGDTDVTRRHAFGAAAFEETLRTRPEYSAWEAGGLLHFWTGGGYRFSGTAGYRQHRWEYNGQVLGGAVGYPARDLFQSHIPYIGLQTAMYFPWWKARCELLGSPFMTKTVSSSLFDTSGNYSTYRIKANRGGFLEFQMQGTMSITGNIHCGLFAKVSLEELHGDLRAYVNDGEVVGTASGRDVYLRESILVGGLDLTILF